MTKRKDMTAAYFDSLNLPSKSGMSKRYQAKKAALNRAHDLRKFEIENYWKRATYFWSFQVIAFGVLGLIFKDGVLSENLQIIQIPAAIGAVSGFVGWLSAKGSKYWQENWEAHVDMLERDVEGRLTQTIWSDGKVSHSVSRLNQAFMGILTLSWIVVMAIPIFDKTLNSLLCKEWISKHSPCFLFVLLMITLGWVCWKTRQDFRGYVLHQDSWIENISNWKWLWKKCGAEKPRQLLLRHTKAKDADNPNH